MSFKAPLDTKNIYLWIISRIGKHKVSIHAGHTSFFVLLSVIPFTMILIRLCLMLPGTNEEFFDRLLDRIGPGMIKNVIGPLVHEEITPTGGLYVITIILLLWAGSKGIDGLMQGLDSIYETHMKRGYIKRRVFSLIYVVGFIITIVVGMAMLVLGVALYDFISSHIDLPLDGFLMQFILTYGLAIFVFVSFFVIMFRFLPYTPTETMEEKLARHKYNRGKSFRERKRKPKYRSIKKEIPGAIVTATMWMTFTRLFGIYVEYRLKNPSYYGAFASIFLMLLWVYFCMVFVLIGALYNNYSYRTGESATKHLFLDFFRLLGWAAGNFINLFRKTKKIKNQLKSNKKEPEINDQNDESQNNNNKNNDI